MLNCTQGQTGSSTTSVIESLGVGGGRQRAILPQTLKQKMRYEGAAMIWYNVDLKCSVTGIQWKPPAGSFPFLTDYLFSPDNHHRNDDDIVVPNSGSDMNYLTSGHNIDYDDLRKAFTLPLLSATIQAVKLCPLSKIF